MHEAIGDAAVVGISDSMYDEAIIGFVTLKTNQSVTEEELKEYCSKKMSKSKIPEKIKILNGNQLASLIVYYSLINLELNKLSKPPYVAKTIVTTRLIDEIANGFGVKSYSTLTGFKYIAELIKNKKSEKFIAGGEESYGYLVDDFVRDKDAIISCAYICEIASWAKDNGKSLNDILEEIYDTYGLFKEKLYTIKMEGISGSNRINDIMEKYRSTPPLKIFGDKVKEVIDYNKREKNPIINAKSNVIQLISEKNYS